MSKQFVHRFVCLKYALASCGGDGGASQVLAHDLATTLTTLIACDDELILGDLASGLDARPVPHPCAVIWHYLAGAVPELHPGAIILQAEPPAAPGKDIPYILMAKCCHDCAAA
eukprot:854603-Amphidinium_carterae.1